METEDPAGGGLLGGFVCEGGGGRGAGTGESDEQLMVV